jgi:hypothetical protein
LVNVALAGQSRMEDSHIILSLELISPHTWLISTMLDADAGTSFMSLLMAKAGVRVLITLQQCPSRARIFI